MSRVGPTSQWIHQALDALSDVFFVLEQDGTLRFWNAQLGAVTGYPDAEIAEMHVLDFFADADRTRIGRTFRTALTKGKATVTAHLVTKDDSRIPFEFTGSALKEETDDTAICSVGRDLRNRETAGPHGETTNSIQSAFLASMSHEIRTPLTAILGFADLLLDECEGETRAMAQYVASSGQRLLDTLNAMLDLATLQSGTARLDYRMIDAGRVLRDVVRSFQPELDRKGLDVGLTVRVDEPVEMEADKTALTSILRNLVSNAVKFTDEGRIDIILDGNDAEVIFQIEDSGVGISPDFLPHIFDGFKQESAGLRREYEGAGIGLATTDQFVRRMGGTIEVESQKSVGSTFTVRLPRGHDVPPPDPAEPAAQDAGPPTSDERPRLLVLEDNTVTLRLLEQILKNAYRIDTATRADAALRRARTSTYDGFVFDINLSEEQRTGVEVLREIRTAPKHRSTPAVACTAYGLRGYEEAFLDAGFDAVVPKPVTKRGLLDTLAETLASPHTARDSTSAHSAVEIDLPPLPTTVPEIARLIARKDDTFALEELTTILERDQIASMWLLHHINSAYYNLNAEVTSINRAVVYAGFRPVCNLVLTEVLNKTFSNLDTPNAKAVYRHIMSTSLAAASFAKELASILDLDRPEIIYSTGLLSQVGRLLLLDQHGEQYAGLWYRDEEPPTFAGPPVAGQEILRFGVNHVQVGVRALRDSDISREILSLIRYHRRPQHIPSDTLKGPALVIAAGLEAAEALFDAPANDTPDLDAVLQHSASLKALAALYHHPTEELAYTLKSNVDRIMSFVESVLSSGEESLRAA